MLNDRPLEQAERKNSPIEVFEKTKALPEFKNDDLETLHDRIRLSYDKWSHAQFKIHGSPIAATYGSNIDKQSSLRTPNIAAFHKPELAQLTLHVLALMAARDGKSFDMLTGHSLPSLMQRAYLDRDFADALTAKMWTASANDGRKLKIATLYNHIRDHGFADMLAATEMAQRLTDAAASRKK